mgnify:CR=1 FL=1
MTAQRHPDGPVVVVGSGLAGWSAVREFRKVDTATPVLMITADAGDFYAKPSLSNAFAQKRGPAQLLTTPAASMADNQKVTLRAHTRVDAIDTAMRLAYERYSGAKGYTPEQFQATMAETAGVDLRTWFADVAGSTALYEVLGDDRAFALVEDCLHRIKATDDRVNAFTDVVADREMLFKNVFRHRKMDILQAPVNLKRLMEKYTNPYSTKTDLTPAYVKSWIGRFIKEFPNNRVFHCLLRYYLAPKKAIVVHRLSQALFDELMRDIRFRYIQSQVHAGEMVGALAAQSIGEPTTQLTLNTFHSAGTAKANATSGVPRIEELLSASSNPKRPSNTIYLQPDINSQDGAVNKMKQIQKTTLRDIAKSVKIFYDPYPLAETTVLPEDRDMLARYEAFSCDDDGSKGSPWIMRVELNELEMAARNIMDAVEIQSKLMAVPALKVVECRYSDPGPTGNGLKNLVMRIMFDPGAVKNPVQLRFLEDKLLETPLTGVSGIGRVHIRKIKSEAVYDEAVGG